MSFSDVTNTIQIIMGLAALLIFLIKIILESKKKGLKIDFSTQMFFFLLLMVIAESLEHLGQSLESVIKPFVPWIYVFASVFILYFLLKHALKTGLLILNS